MKTHQAVVVISDDEDEYQPRQFSKTSRAHSTSSTSTCTLGRTPDPIDQHSNAKTVGPLATSPEAGSLQKVSPNKRSREELDRNNDTFPGHRRRPFQDERLPPIIYDLEHEDDEVRRFDAKKDVLIDLEQEDEEELEVELFRPRTSGPATREAANQRNAPIQRPWIVIDNYDWNDSLLRVGKTVELADTTFLQITVLLIDPGTNSVRLRGIRLKRSRDVKGMLQMKLNELVYIYEIDLDDQRSAVEQSVVEYELQDVLKVRRLLRTNRPFPDCRFARESVPDIYKNDGNLDAAAMMRHVEENDILVVRWKYVSVYKTSLERINMAGRQINFKQQKLELLIDEECSARLHLPAFVRRLDWRGDTTLGGSGIEEGNPQNRRILQENRCPNMQTVIDLSIDDDDLSQGIKVEQKPKRNQASVLNDLASVAGGERRTIVQRYTFGDSFCGAGGTTRGAVMAKLNVQWGFDFDNNAGQTWKHNFRNSRFFEQWADEFIAFPHENKSILVDILHLSPPCQVFSPIKVHEGKNDETNFASLFAVQELIEKVKPRMVTLEQTFGILHNKHKAAFHALIRMFTDHGFSVSWQVVDFHHWGLAQRRKRLIIVAACPGETLPELPPYTHSETGGNGLKKYTSVRSVLASIPRNASNHDIASMKAGIYPAWDDSGIVTCLTTAGPIGKGHPNGRRKLTMREMAALQSYPNNHVFLGKQISRQIGNSVPPMIAAILLTTVRKHLEKADKVELEGFVADGRSV